MAGGALHLVARAQRFAARFARARMLSAKRGAALCADGRMVRAERILADRAEHEITQAQRAIMPDAGPDMVGAKPITTVVADTRAFGARQLTAQATMDQGRPVTLVEPCSATMRARGVTCSAQDAPARRYRSRMRGHAALITDRRADTATAAVDTERRAVTVRGLDDDVCDWTADEAGRFQTRLHFDAVDLRKAGQLAIERRRYRSRIIRSLALEALVGRGDILDTPLILGANTLNQVCRQRFEAGAEGGLRTIGGGARI